MLNWLRTSIRNWLSEEPKQKQDPRLKGIEAIPQIMASDESEGLRSRPINVNLYRADGGWVVETVNYVERSLGHDTERRVKLHLVTDDQDLGESLAKIVFTVQLIK